MARRAVRPRLGPAVRVARAFSGDRATAKALAKIAGDDNYEAWGGTRVELFTTTGRTPTISWSRISAKG